MKPGSDPLHPIPSGPPARERSSASVVRNADAFTACPSPHLRCVGSCGPQTERGRDADANIRIPGDTRSRIVLLTSPTPLRTHCFQR
jgi:hypothetical protein